MFWPRSSKRLLSAAGTVVALLGLSIFTPTTLFPEGNLEAPRTAFLIDHGTHSSLAIETQDGNVNRYAYGDMRYYAKRDTSLASGAAALFFLTPATLGRAELVGPAQLQTLREQLVVGVETIYEIQVEAVLAERLIERLDEIFFGASSEHITVAAYGLVFAPHPDPYFWANNSSTVVAHWLRELGVNVFGWGLLASWNLAS